MSSLSSSGREMGISSSDTASRRAGIQQQQRKHGSALPALEGHFLKLYKNHQSPLPSCSHCNAGRAELPPRLQRPPRQLARKMDQETLGSVVLLAIVTLISVVQNAFFASKVEHESKHCNGKGIQRPGSSAFDRVYTANQNCGHAYPTFLAVLWCAGLLCSQAPAAFAGLMYLFVRQKYFVGYLGERTQSTPGYLFGKRIILFLFLMSVAGILNYYLIYFFGSDFEMHIKTITSAISPLLLIP